jgi:hypothetical protein
MRAAAAAHIGRPRLAIPVVARAVLAARAAVALVELLLPLERRIQVVAAVHGNLAQVALQMAALVS